MYIVKLDNEFLSGFGEFYRPDYEISEPEIEMSVNSIGHFSFTIYPTHPKYNEITLPKKIISVIRYGENEPIFIGRVSEVETGFYNEKTITCESELAFLLDSVRTDFFTTIGYGAEYWLGHILEFHNNHMNSFGSIYENNICRKFEAGYVSESISSKILYINKDEFSGTYTTFDIIINFLINRLGGVLKLRHEDDKNYIDWVDESDLEAIAQKIEFGSNLLDLNSDIQYDQIVTAIRPVGESVQSGDEYNPLDIRLFDASPYIDNDDVKQVIDKEKTTNLKFSDTLYSEKLVEKYGWIQREIKFDGVINPIDLVNKAEKFFSSVGISSSITISAVDLAKTNNSIENFRAGDCVIVNSMPHNISEQKFLITSSVLNLADPSKSKVTFGTEAETITSQAEGSMNYAGNIKIIDTTGGNPEGSFDPYGSASAALNQAKSYVNIQLEDKVDKQEGKGLSTNDFTNVYKNQIDTNKNNISSLQSGKVDKEEGMGLSSNDFTNLEKNQLWKNAADITSLMYGKVDVMEGKGLSTNDFTNAYKNKIDSNTSALGGHTVGVDVPANAKFTDTTYSNFVKSGSGAKAGLVPAPPTTAGTAKYLREDGTWVNPNIKWYVGTNNANSSGWYHFLSKTMGEYDDLNLMLAITNDFNENCFGILSIHIRRDNTATTPLPNIFGWLVRRGFSSDQVIAIRNGLVIDFYINQPVKQFGRITFTVLHSCGRGEWYGSFTPISNTSPTINLTADVISVDLGVVSTAKKIQNSGDVLFNDTGTNITSCSVNGLFTNNSFVLATITSDKYGVKQYILPMAHLKAKGWLKLADSGTSDSNSDLINFQYQNDNTLMWFEKQDSGAAKYTAVTLIKML